VIATDADREGEMIAREIIELCGYRGPIQRLWLSALNDASIRKALGALKPSAETLPLYYSALARSRADWLIGMNLSRCSRCWGARPATPACCRWAGCRRRR
jgi:DNA topoisomerase-3